MKFSIDPKIFDQWPGVKIGVAFLTGIDNSKKVPEIVQLLRDQEEQVKQELTGKESLDLPEVTVWRQVYKDFGSDPHDFKSSVEALIKRAKNGKPLPEINPLVDLYNYLSLKYKIPAGAEDLDKTVSDISLSLSKGTEEGKTIGSEEVERCYEGEVVYKDAESFICRRWNWREADRTKIEFNTQNSVLVLECMPPCSEETLHEALQEARDLIKKYLGGKVEQHVLSKENREVEVDKSSKNKNLLRRTLRSSPAEPNAGLKSSNSNKANKSSDKKGKDGNSGKIGKTGMKEQEKIKRVYLQGSIGREIAEAVLHAVKEVFPEIKIELEDVELDHPPLEQHGDYFTNIALQLAKSNHTNPRETAQKIVESLKTDTKMRPHISVRKEEDKLSDGPVWEKVEVAGPGFINFYLKEEVLIKQVEKVLEEEESFGENATGKGKKVALEHTNVNPNKALHIGHLRNGCIGQAMERLWEACGYDVEVQYYVDDTGDQVAGTVLALKTLKIEPQEGIKFDHFSWDMYARISSMYETDEEIAQKKQEILHAIEQGDNEVAKFTKEVATKIIYDNLLTCHWYGFDYDVLIWEGDILRLGLWKRAFEILKKSAAFKLETEGKNKGCWVIKDEATGGQLGGDKVLVRSNGTVIYAGKDIAYHMWKFDLLGVDFNYNLFPDAPQVKPLWTTTSEEGKGNPGIGKADIVLNVIDLRQSFTLESVKLALKALGYPKQSENIHHIAYGVVYLSEGSMKKMGFATEEGKKIYAMAGRKGIGIMADVLLDKVRLEVEKNFPDSTDLSQPIAVAAIKYSMLTYNTFSDIVFDLEQALSLSGVSGPYIQYTYARARSVLRKAETSHLSLDTGKNSLVTNDQSLLTSEEQSILRYLYRFPEVILQSAQTYSPNLLCAYLFELAKRFNNFYNNVPILSVGAIHESPKTRAHHDAPLQNFRLALTQATSIILANGLSLLGIEVLERM